MRNGHKPKPKLPRRPLPSRLTDRSDCKSWREAALHLKLCSDPQTYLKVRMATGMTLGYLYQMRTAKSSVKIKQKRCRRSGRRRKSCTKSFWPGAKSRRADPVDNPLSTRVIF